MPLLIRFIILALDRNVPRKPRLVDGVKGHNMNDNTVERLLQGYGGGSAKDAGPRRAGGRGTEHLSPTIVLTTIEKK